MLQTILTALLATAGLGQDATRAPLLAKAEKAATVLFAYYTDLDSPGTPYVSSAGDSLAFAMATGDFNSDGWADLAVGVPGKQYNGVLADAGAVIVFYGRYHGLPDNIVALTQTLAANADGVEADDFFGWSLAAGDFDGDGFDDLAVGSPYEDVTTDFNDPGNSTFSNAGAVNIFYGAAQGLSSTSDYIHIDSDAPFGGELLQDNAMFGYALTAGDFNQDGEDDLVVSVYRHDETISVGNSVEDSGLVMVYRGFPGGLSGGNRVPISQSPANVVGVPEVGDYFGLALTAADFNQDGHDDLVVGVPYEDFNGVTDAGVVQVFYGTDDDIGLFAGNEIWSQDDLSGVVLEVNDLFGFSLSHGDVNGDGVQDLLVGAPYEDLNAIVDAGAVHVILGDVAGLTATGNITLTQDSGSLFGAAETGDVFGLILQSGDFNLDGFDDVVIGTPFEDTAANNGGLVHIVFGSSSGVNVNDTQHFLSDALNANLGFALSSGDYGFGPTLQIGQPGLESTDNDLLAGAFLTFVFENPHVIFAHGFESIGK